VVLPTAKTGRFGARLGGLLLQPPALELERFPVSRAHADLANLLCQVARLRQRPRRALIRPPRLVQSTGLRLQLFQHARERGGAEAGAEDQPPDLGVWVQKLRRALVELAAGVLDERGSFGARLAG